VRHNQRARVRGFLFAGGAFAILFLTGQLLAWHQLRDSGYGLTSGPAGAFFYVLTGVHGLHLLGGLGVWLKTVARMRTRAVELIEVRLSIELCTVYWHYLLLVWLVMFVLLLSTDAKDLSHGTRRIDHGTTGCGPRPWTASSRIGRATSRRSQCPGARR